MLFSGILLFAQALPTNAAVHVRGYFRSNGTYVAPHYRSNPDGIFSNNYSTYGNVNPYTGKEGTKLSPSSSSSYLFDYASLFATPTPIPTVKPKPIKKINLWPTVKTDGRGKGVVMVSGGLLHIYNGKDIHLCQLPSPVESKVSLKMHIDDVYRCITGKSITNDIRKFWQNKIEKDTTLLTRARVAGAMVKQYGTKK